MRGVIQNPGDLRHRVELQRRALLSDELGGQSESWIKVSDLWAHVSVQSQREGASGDHLDGELSYEVTIRHRNNVDVGMRFVHEDKVLTILSCADFTGKRCFLVCLCRQIK